MDNDDAKRLSLAIVAQAIDDWRYLCDGGEEIARCNFNELTDFFKTDCDTYLTGTEISAEKIFARLMHEKAISNHEQKREKKRKEKALKKISTLKSQMGMV